MSRGGITPRAKVPAKHFKVLESQILFDIKATVEVQERTDQLGIRLGSQLCQSMEQKCTKRFVVDDKQQITVLAATLVEEVSLYIPVHTSLQFTNMPPCISSSPVKFISSRMEREIDSFFMVKQTNHEDLHRGDCVLHEVEKSIVEAE